MNGQKDRVRRLQSLYLSRNKESLNNHNLDIVYVLICDLKGIHVLQNYRNLDTERLELFSSSVPLKNIQNCF